MTGLRSLYRRWQIAHYELQRLHVDEARTRAETMLGAYGLTSVGRSVGVAGRSR